MEQYEELIELTRGDFSSFKNFMRMDRVMSQKLLATIGPKIEKEALDLEPKLALTLRYLYSGNSYMSFMYGFRSTFNTTYEAVIEEYAEEIIPCPTS